MIHKIIALVFIIFGAVQYNDPDFYIWMPIYFLVAAVVLAFDRGWRNKTIITVLCAIYLIGMLTYTPQVLSWVQNGTPSIAGSMKAESPFIEFVREFFGLGICLLGLGYYWRKVK